MLNIKLTMTEFVELKYLHAIGFDYLVRDEIGKAVVFKNKPCRETNEVYGYRHWIQEGLTSWTTKEIKNRRKTELGSYEFIQFENEPIFIKDILVGYEIIEK